MLVKSPANCLRIKNTSFKRVCNVPYISVDEEDDDDGSNDEFLPALWLPSKYEYEGQFPNR